MKPVLMVMALLALVGACGSSSSGADAGDRLPDHCCPIEPASCDCFAIGGTGSPDQDGELQCTRVCDAEPDGWQRYVNDAGCPELRWVGGTGSCLLPPDAMPSDALLPDAGVPDAPPAPNMIF